MTHGSAWMSWSTHQTSSRICSKPRPCSRMPFVGGGSSMRPDPAAEGRRWFAQAEHDLASAIDLSDHGHYNVACFQCQQAIEKALKAFLYHRGARQVLHLDPLSQRPCLWQPSLRSLRCRRCRQGHPYGPAGTGVHQGSAPLAGFHRHQLSQILPHTNLSSKTPSLRDAFLRRASRRKPMLSKISNNQNSPA